MTSFEGEAESCVAVGVWNRQTPTHGTTGLCEPCGPNNDVQIWPNHCIPYHLSATLSPHVRKVVERSIAEWNCVNPCIQWLPSETPDEKVKSVEFRQDDSDSSCEASQIGYKADSNWIRLNGNFQRLGIYMVDVLHEMMHIAGFRHEFARPDTTQHREGSMEGDGSAVVALGSFDYNSIMQYPISCNSCCDVWTKSKEFAKKSEDTPYKTFSAGDKAAIKMIYGKAKAHHGEWHRACIVAKGCSETVCCCGGCGPLGDGANCGYSGMRGHWTCCMSELQDSECLVTHTGFWHAKCEKNCTREICYCNNCGSGCTYIGTEAHWSCCNNELFDSLCSKQRK